MSSDGRIRVPADLDAVLGAEMLGITERRFRPRRKDLGFVFQDPATSFNPLLTIAQCVAEPLVVHGGARRAADARDKVDELLEAVQLPKAYGDRYPHELSGGQRQRVAIARVMLKDAPVLLLDEATSALDSEVEASIQESLQELMKGKTVIAIAHRLSTIAALDRLIVLDAGRVVEEGTHAQLLARGGIYAGLWARQSGGFLGEQGEDGGV